MSERIAIENVKPGMVIIKVTAQNGPVKIKKSGLVNSKDMVKALAEMGVQEVEIDPDITVELPKKKIPKSKTQELLDAPGHATMAMDNSISEQFNRSLFLPSVQELPEAWQYYGKKAALVVLVIAGGLGLGYSGANITSWLTPAKSQVAVIEPAHTASTVGQIAPLQQAEIPESKNDGTMELQESKPESSVAKIFSPNKPQNTLAEETPKEADGQAVADFAQSSNEEAQEQPNASISPELLKRFEKAVAAIDEQPISDPADSLSPQNDVPPVQDLPAWILTQLPSMSFSAHMYASAQQDRWVRVNGRRVKEGQEVEQGVRLVGIEPQHVILAYKGQEFSMEALSEW